METVKVDPNDFAVAMYSRLSQPRRNLFFSPFSIRTALAMTYAGACGETATEMHEALRFAGADEGLHSVLARMITRLTTASQGEYEMVVANSLWCQEDVALLPEFLRLVHLYYGNGLNRVDFIRQAEAARAAMNCWVEETTRKKIRELIPPGGVDEQTRLVLMNAVYFMGTWERKFLEELTSPAPFHLESRQNEMVPMMFQEASVQYMRGSDFQAVDLPYKGCDVSMLVLLPDRTNGIADLEARLTARLLQDCANDLETQTVRLFLPRFRMTWGTVDLKNHLSALGMTKAFDPGQADFSGINGVRPPDPDSLSITSVFHKAFVEVDEEGTRAAAATFGGLLYGRKPEPITFRADHPFLFAIRDSASGAILFLGRVTHPLEG